MCRVAVHRLPGLRGPCHEVGLAAAMTSPDPPATPCEPRPTIVLGRYGEDLAARYLRDRGMTIVERNWRCS